MNRKIISVLGATALVASLGLTGCSNSSNSNSSSKSSKVSKKSNDNKIIFQDKELRSKFDQIKVGEIMNQGNGGSTETEVKKLLGSPTSTSSSKTNGIKTSSHVWNKGKVQITVAFVDHNAISKMITGFKWNGRPDKLDLKAYNHVKDGSSYDSLVKKFGEPDGLDESLIMGTRTVMATYITGVKGDAGASAVFSFSNNKLTNKTQTDLK